MKLSVPGAMLASVLSISFVVGVGAVGCRTAGEPTAPPPAEASRPADPLASSDPMPPTSAPAAAPTVAPAVSSTEEPDGALDVDKIVDPPPGALAWISGGKIQIANPIVFEIAKDRIRPESFPTLDAVVEVLLQNKAIRVEVGGHLENDGAPHYGSDLSKKRARRVRDYLIHKGVDPDRLTAVGFGDNKPIAPPAAPGKPSQNRRIELVILKR